MLRSLVGSEMCIRDRPVAQFAGGRLKEKCAAARNACGKGMVYYLGVYLPAEAMAAFAAAVLPAFPIADIPENVEIARRTGKQGSYMFVINHGSQSEVITLPQALAELITGEKAGPEVKIARNGVLIFKT